MTCDHDWYDITTIKDIESKQICVKCDARRSGSEPLPNIEPPQSINDGWNGFRRFFAQLDEGRYE